MNVRVQSNIKESRSTSSRVMKWNLFTHFGVSLQFVNNTKDDDSSCHMVEFTSLPVYLLHYRLATSLS
jgi:hypothetical protein